MPLCIEALASTRVTWVSSGPALLTRAKQSFEDTCVPKQELGNEAKSCNRKLESLRAVFERVRIPTQGRQSFAGKMQRAGDENLLGRRVGRGEGFRDG
jgi:hypothetical protein